MKNAETMKARIAAVTLSALLLSLYGCGGGDGDNKSQLVTPGAATTAELVSEAQGIYLGHLNATTAIVSMIVLDDGTYWLDYSNAMHEIGLIQGHMSVLHGTYVSQDALDFNFATKGDPEHRSPASITGQVYVKRSLDGTISYADGSSTNKLRIGFFGDNNGYGNWYEQAPDMGKMVGTYNNVHAYAANLHDTHATVTVRADGTLSLAMGPCSAQGKLQPHARGNVFDLTLSFAQAVNGAPCKLAGEQLSGVAFADSAGQKSFSLMGLNATRTHAMKLRLSYS